jgi:hypothetical protein
VVTLSGAGQFFEEIQALANYISDTGWNDELV